MAWAGTLSMLKMRNLFISSLASYTSQYDDPIQHHLHSQATVSGGDLNRKPAEEDMLGASAKGALSISAGTLLWIYWRLFCRSYIALARQDQ